jgi:hypothetical protein
VNWRVNVNRKFGDELTDVEMRVKLSALEVLEADRRFHRKPSATLVGEHRRPRDTWDRFHLSRMKRINTGLLKRAQKRRVRLIE